jgi:hypothetical protein
VSSPHSLARVIDLHVGGFTLSRHARERRVEFEITRSQLEDILLRPQVRYETTARRRGARTFTYQHGEWAAIVDEVAKRVVTIVRRRVERWEH